MSKIKIKKNLSDQDMLANWQEPASFETASHDEKTTVQTARGKGRESESFHGSFLTPQLQEKVGKALLDLKLALYKEGIVDYEIKVARQGHQVILTAAPKAAKPSPKSRP
ncbi:hypothetical protein [Sporolituus thermophilus]|uniref:Uncharacterized protein n=1 Tax=Sporolituus thermophilus DSM 23256 TaxID=1123285 RepID=A0A1G7LSU7_9FIRM|nr:hypothetical protein [Sporolituus thermophilus]SDF52466.1 hypothetical protein SAMN05660235_01896 [Sporolituus thermophilus DSM 23256]